MEQFGNWRRIMGVFEWFRQFGAKYALIRQINNPLAGLDYGLLAFIGIGVLQQKSFGFASCPRLCLSAEGMNVLIERKIRDGYSYVISNVEYTDFEKYKHCGSPADSRPALFALYFQYKYPFYRIVRY